MQDEYDKVYLANKIKNLWYILQLGPVTICYGSNNNSGRYLAFLGSFYSRIPLTSCASEQFPYNQIKRHNTNATALTVPHSANFISTQISQFCLL